MLRVSTNKLSIAMCRLDDTYATTWKLVSTIMVNDMLFMALFRKTLPPLPLPPLGVLAPPGEGIYSMLILI